ncbi:hypothetical protein QWY93_12400 [Echinicola jeungdonensis]|uniref:Tetratricopeptide repeat protein n=1 Tax=Echinicola jeungdonensis TaxID=709343 RepID=A0ABV5J2J6_9BACT|nr:hypothetical protein [Echinicola jeungdonensis]MDN3670126.1 hypothetical protein [Echinicola jeungdonensis]
MNAKQLLEIIHKGNSLDKEDFRALIKLHETFPYFLVPKVLAAKYEYNISKGESKELLHWAAVQSPNRSWLKKLILNDLDFIKGNPSPIIGPPRTNPSSEPKTENNPADNDNQDALKTGSSSKEAVLKQLEENLAKLKNKEKLSPSQDESPPKTNKSSAAEDLIESIKKKEKKIINDVRKREQGDIISSFNKKNIKLAAIKENENTEKNQDLSIHSTQLNENLLSESYAKLLSKQGKKEKAIKIYEKLILKFPKKKAYFANLINELKD